jgi:hypothetical protein
MNRYTLRTAIIALATLPLLLAACADTEDATGQTEDNYASERDEAAIAAIRAAVADTSQAHVDFTVCETFEGEGEPCGDTECADGLECVVPEAVDGEETVEGVCNYLGERACHAASIEEIPAPDGYPRPSVDGFSLGGTEFWQRWPGGESPTFSYSVGTDFGRRCMTAAALRFEAIMADPPEEIVTLRDQSNWSGSFFNWVDDYSHESASSDARGARLWAWRTGLVKWISQTAKDGSCHLPTREMVLEAAASCLATAESDDGEIQGCRAQ